ncbi:MAG: hypothetical protein ACO1NW_06080 [Chitinophagaceae bacterium]
MRYRINIVLLFTLVFSSALQAQELRDSADCLVLKGKGMSVVFNRSSGVIGYHMEAAGTLPVTQAYVELLNEGTVSSTGLQKHVITIDTLNDPIGKGLCVNFTHVDHSGTLNMVQHVTLYENQEYVLVSMEVNALSGKILETRNISPLAATGNVRINGTHPRLMDQPFDNDNWVDVLERNWEKGAFSGTSYECISGYDHHGMNGFLIGTLVHDRWKTGFRYAAAAATGLLDSLTVYGGAATPDNPSLPGAHGGYDGTHDVVPHGTMRGTQLLSPLLFIGYGPDVRESFVQYGRLNRKVSGGLSWKGFAPFYWNSFGVEGVLGYEKVMMPSGVVKIADFLHTLRHFNQYAKPVMSIDSYDQTIYTTDMLRSIDKYGTKKNQQMGFYFIPFAHWTWKNTIQTADFPGTGYALRDVVLKDMAGQPVPYKNGEWGAYPLDPTHPGTRKHIIANLQKAKAINARFIKIDFLSAGALESATRFDPNIRTGMEAYNYGMKMLKALVDSIMGPDIFITMAISPMFPHQYAHTRFVSTDVYSHLRNDMPGFPHYGSTRASLSNGTHYWWVKGTLWPYTNMDVVVMKHFQKHPDLSEQDIKVRLYAMMVMGSILGDGSDFRDKTAAERARKFLDHPGICAFFSQPKVFTPLRFSDGETEDQQLAFLLKGGTTMLGLFNFCKEGTYEAVFSRSYLGLSEGAYSLVDFMTEAVVGTLQENENTIRCIVPPKDAQMLKLVRK